MKRKAPIRHTKVRDKVETRHRHFNAKISTSFSVTLHGVAKQIPKRTTHMHSLRKSQRLCRRTRMMGQEPSVD